MASVQEKPCTLISHGGPAGGAEVLLLQGRGNAQMYTGTAHVHLHSSYMQALISGQL